MTNNVYFPFACAISATPARAESLLPMMFMMTARIARPSKMSVSHCVGSITLPFENEG
jgi:hypothetical protein